MYYFYDRFGGLHEAATMAEAGNKISLLQTECAHSLPIWYAEHKPAPSHIPSHVIYNGVTTIAVFPDGKKIKARPDQGAEFDPETGLAMCIARHVFGSRAAFLKAVEGATNQNKVEACETLKHTGSGAWCEMCRFSTTCGERNR